MLGPPLSSSSALTLGKDALLQAVPSPLPSNLSRFNFLPSREAQRRAPEAGPQVPGLRESHVQAHEVRQSLKKKDLRVLFSHQPAVFSTRDCASLPRGAAFPHFSLDSPVCPASAWDLSVQLPVLAPCSLPDLFQAET